MENTTGAQQAAVLVLRSAPTSDGYFSASYYLPEPVNVGVFWVIMKFRTRLVADDPTTSQLYDLNLKTLMLSSDDAAPGDQARDDAKLVARGARAGDERAVRTLLTGLGPAMLRVIRKILGGTDRDATTYCSPQVHVDEPRRSRITEGSSRSSVKPSLAPANPAPHSLPISRTPMSFPNEIRRAPRRLRPLARRALVSLSSKPMERALASGAGPQSPESPSME